MLNSDEKIIQLVDLEMTYRELEAICIGYKDRDVELFDYYDSMKKWVLSVHKHLRLELLIILNIHKEILDNKEREREQREQEFEAKKRISENEKDIIKKAVLTVNEKITTQERRKMPFEKHFEFKIFGYKIYTFLEIEKK